MTNTPQPTETYQQRTAREYRERWTAAIEHARSVGRKHVVCTIGTQTIHAARTTITGNGVMHPRALCQPHSPRTYAGLISDQDKPVTCQRCLASIAKHASRSNSNPSNTTPEVPTMSDQQITSYDVRVQPEGTDTDDARVTVRVDASDTKSAREQALAQTPGQIVKVRKTRSKSEPEQTSEQPVDEPQPEPEQSEPESTPEPTSDESPAPQLTPDEQLKATLKRAQMSASSDLSAEQRERAINAPDTLKTSASLRKFILHGTNGNGEQRQRSPEHAPIAKAATELIRTNSPARAAISTRAVAATVEFLKTHRPARNALSGDELQQLAIGKVRLTAVDEQLRKSLKDATQQIGEAAQLKRFEARELAAIVAAQAAA